MALESPAVLSLARRFHLGTIESRSGEFIALGFRFSRRMLPRAGARNEIHDHVNDPFCEHCQYIEHSVTSSLTGSRVLAEVRATDDVQVPVVVGGPRREAEVAE